MFSVSSLDLDRAAYLFDLDGTLVDSLQVHEWCFRRVLARYCPEALDTFEYHDFLGWRTEDVFRAVRAAVDPVAIHALVAEKRAAYRQAVDAGMVRPFPKVRDVLTLLRRRNRQLYIVTGGSAESTTILLQRAGLSGFFAGSITGDDAHASKPDPDPFLMALDKFHLRPDDCLTIEDSDDGALASERAGVEAILVNRHPSVGRTAFTDFGQLSLALHHALHEV
jgi:HAD superfamily hydrolase (TIGR01509 family)